MSRQHNNRLPTLYELLVLSALKQAGGEFVPTTTIKHRINVDDIDPSEHGLHDLMHRFEERGWTVIVKQLPSINGDSGRGPILYHTLTDEGRAVLEKWIPLVKAIL